MTKIFGKEILRFDKIDSTQSYAKRIINEGNAKEGGVIIADEQTDGYGRCGRKWYSPDGGLWFSVMVRSEISIKDAGRLIPIIALSIVEMLEKVSGIEVAIRWPNDILIEGKKIAGCIVETLSEHNQIKWIIFGVGININNPIPEELEGDAISLKKVAHKEFNLTSLLSLLIGYIENKYMDFLDGKINKYWTRYKEKSVLLGNNVKITQGGKAYSGLVKDIDVEGKLILQSDNGRIIEIIAADTVLLSE
jgi:BirA family biotin operon repressor/biotin-[acetyl-CoA-carboxylase] ligase